MDGHLLSVRNSDAEQEDRHRPRLPQDRRLPNHLKKTKTLSLVRPKPLLYYPFARAGVDDDHSGRGGVFLQVGGGLRANVGRRRVGGTRGEGKRVNNLTTWPRDVIP